MEYLAKPRKQKWRAGTWSIPQLHGEKRLTAVTPGNGRQSPCSSEQWWLYSCLSLPLDADTPNFTHAVNTVFPRCYSCVLRGTDHGGRCCGFPRDFTSLSLQALMEVSELFIGVFRGVGLGTCNHRTESDWLHRLSNPVICNHRQLHPFSDVRLLSQIRQVSSPSVPESRTGLIRRASL